MRPLDYTACKTLEDAVGILSASAGPPRILAGGTDLVIELRTPGARTTSSVLDISRIAALKGITRRGEDICVGPLTTHAGIAGDPLIADAGPLLAAASRGVGSVQIRNRGTIGGNVMNAATCADTIPPLVALEARFRLVSSRGVREVPAAKFFTAPYQTVAMPDELLTAILFAPLAHGTTGVFLKLGRRNAVSISRLSVAAIVERNENGSMRSARVVPGSATPVWSRMTGVESMLADQHPSIELFREAGRAAAHAMVQQTGRRWSTEYKEMVLAVLVRRALQACCGIREEGVPRP